MVGCAAFNCNVRSGQGVSLYLFPKDPKLRELWTVKLKRDGFKPSPYSKLCSHHFTKDQYIINPDVASSIGFITKKMLNRDAIPTIFDYSEPRNQRKRNIDVKISANSSISTKRNIDVKRSATSSILTHRKRQCSQSDGKQEVKRRAHTSILTRSRTREKRRCLQVIQGLLEENAKIGNLEEDLEMSPKLTGFLWNIRRKKVTLDQMQSFNENMMGSGQKREEETITRQVPEEELKQNEEQELQYQQDVPKQNNKQLQCQLDGVITYPQIIPKGLRKSLHYQQDIQKQKDKPLQFHPYLPKQKDKSLNVQQDVPKQIGGFKPFQFPQVVPKTLQITFNLIHKKQNNPNESTSKQNVNEYKTDNTTKYPKLTGKCADFSVESFHHHKQQETFGLNRSEISSNESNASINSIDYHTNNEVNGISNDKLCHFDDNVAVNPSSHYYMESVYSNEISKEHSVPETCDIANECGLKVQVKEEPEEFVVDFCHLDRKNIGQVQFEASELTQDTNKFNCNMGDIQSVVNKNRELFHIKTEPNDTESFSNLDNKRGPLQFNRCEKTLDSNEFKSNIGDFQSVASENEDVLNIMKEPRESNCHIGEFPSQNGELVHIKKEHDSDYDISDNIQNTLKEPIKMECCDLIDICENQNITVHPVVKSDEEWKVVLNPEWGDRKLIDPS